MKLAISSALALLLGAIPVYAHQEQDKDKPPQQEEKKQEPDKKQEDKKPENKKPQEKPQDEKRPPAEKGQPPRQQEQKDRDNQQKDERKNRDKQLKDQQKNQQHEQQQDRQRNEQPQQDRGRQDQQAQRNNGNGNRGGRRIPEERFHANFGSSHHFHVRRSDDRHFAFGGFTFEYTEAWPAGWSYDDDVYIDEIDGEYYLIDPFHPGIRLLVVVVE